MDCEPYRFFLMVEIEIDIQIDQKNLLKIGKNTSLKKGRKMV